MKPKKGSLGKTARPSLSGILPRRRLFDLLDRGREGAAIWVSGPPGCGKTTLVASWLDHAALNGLWYQLDDGDADVATFFYYLSAAAADLERRCDFHFPDRRSNSWILYPGCRAGSAPGWADNRRRILAHRR